MGRAIGSYLPTVVVEHHPRRTPGKAVWGIQLRQLLQVVRHGDHPISQCANQPLIDAATAGSAQVLGCQTFAAARSGRHAPVLEALNTYWTATVSALLALLREFVLETVRDHGLR